MRRSLVAGLVVAALPMVASAQATFKYGDDIAGELKIVGPVYFSEGSDIGAMALFDMEGTFPDLDETELGRATEVACNVMREPILAAATQVEDEEYTVIAIQFRWSASLPGATVAETFKAWTGVYRADDCAPLKR